MKFNYILFYCANNLYFLIFVHFENEVFCVKPLEIPSRYSKAKDVHRK